ncbi:MAG: hypothetical protein ACE5E5_02530 [Phycisphaerae bacterium]
MMPTCKRLFQIRTVAALGMLAVVGCAAPSGGRDAAKPRAQAEGARAAAPHVGQEAPGFELRRLNDRAQRVKLASFADKKPVVLFFGSYT